MFSTPYSITSVDKDDLNNEPSTSEICKGKTPRKNRYKTEIEQALAKISVINR
jgi:hypothetical protein